jgi:hypothetical protein
MKEILKKWLWIGIGLTILSYFLFVPTVVGQSSFAPTSGGQSPIESKYAALGGAGGFLGNPVTEELSTPDGSGRYRYYQGGAIYWSPQTGAHEVHGDILSKWASLGWERSSLGYPTTDEDTTEFVWATPPGQPTPPPVPAGRAGRYNDFQHGSIYWSLQTGAYVVSSSIPGQHFSPEAEAGRNDCKVHVTGGLLAGLARIFSTVGTAGFWQYDPVNEQVNVGSIFPEWAPIVDPSSVVLEGTAVPEKLNDRRPSVSFQDLPISHYTHDFDFAVLPDATPDNRYANLLATQIYPAFNTARQEAIGVEWETGLAASNDGNPLQAANEQGDSGGFFTRGHQRGDVIWNWPSLGDWVHVEGLWIWDRGHPPAQAEIHPPRLIAVRRHLPALIQPSEGIEPGPSILATRIDLFANGDGTALRNNNPNAPPFVAPVFMNDRDYTFQISTILPRPSPNAKLKWIVEKHPGDTYPLPNIVSPVTIAVPPGSPTPPSPDYILVSLRWHSQHIPNRAVLARTIYLYWDEGRGVPETYRPRVFHVTLDGVYVLQTSDTLSNGEYRVFADVGGNWIFANELQSPSDILNDGLGDTGSGHFWQINRQFTVIVPPGSSFRVHSDGWEADGVNDVFGKLIDPNHPCDQSLKNWLTDNLFTESVWVNGGMDDPIGEVNSIFDAGNGFGVGQAHSDPSAGDIYRDDPNGDTDPNNAYHLNYHIEEVSW